MVWAMVQQTGWLSYEIMEGKQNSNSYIRILKERDFKIIKINFKEKMIFIQDNCPIQKSHKTRHFIDNIGCDVLEQRPYSADLNAIENI